VSIFVENFFLYFYECLCESVCAVNAVIDQRADLHTHTHTHTHTQRERERGQARLLLSNQQDCRFILVVNKTNIIGGRFQSISTSTFYI